MDYREVLIVFGGVVVANSIFFAGYLFAVDKNKPPNRILSLLLIAIALRISKSLIAIIWPDSFLLFPTIGIMGMASIGPLLLLYVRSTIHQQSKVKRSDLLHFIPALLVFLAFPFSSETQVYGYYLSIAAQLSIYTVLSIVSVVTWRNSANGQRQWVLTVTSGVAVLWVTFLIQIVWDWYLSYLAVTIVATLVLFIISYRAMRNNSGIFFVNKKKRMQPQDLIAIEKSVLELLENRKIYKESSVTIKRVASEIKVQPYLLSQAINEIFGMSFPELLNKYRVEEAAQLLQTSKYNHLSIEAIANECGFNAMSAFYSGFKKIKGLTPAEYRKSAF